MTYRHAIEKFHARDGEDVNMWLKRWTILKTTKNWQDVEAINNAVLNLGAGPFQWYLMHGTQITAWEDFYRAIQTRYGDDEQTLLSVLASQVLHQALQISVS